MNKKMSEAAANYSQVRRSNICKSLEHRLEVARQQGDESLIRMLESEQQQMSCSLS